MDALQEWEESLTRVLTPEAARIVKTTPTTMRNWRKAGVGPRYLKIVGRYWYRISDLREFIDAGIVEPKAAANG